jgi:integrase/recombinase XerD
MATTGDRWTAKNLLAAFDEHLHRVRGVCPGTRRNYGRYAGGFLGIVFAGGPVDVATIGLGDVAGFVGGLTRRYPRTVELAASALRSFFRFLRAAGLRGDRLEEAVPMVPHRPGGSGLLT